MEKTCGEWPPTLQQEMSHLCGNSSNGPKPQKGYCSKPLHAWFGPYVGRFRVQGETADSKGYRYALVGVYTMPRLRGYRDYKTPEEEGEDEDDGPGVGPVPLEEEPDFLEERDEDQPEVSRDDREEMNKANEDFKKLFREIGDTLEYQNLHYMIPLKTRKAPEVEAAIRLLYVQLRSEGLPVQRVHSGQSP